MTKPITIYNYKSERQHHARGIEDRKHSHVRVGPTLRLHSHHPAQLAGHAIKYMSLRGDARTKRQRSALEEYRSNSIFHIKAQPRHPVQQVLAAHFGIFDDLFFDRKVSPHTHFSLRPETSSQMGGTYGVTVHLRPARKIDNKACSCMIRIYKDDRPLDDLDKMVWYLCVVLHEMAHAFLGLYVCDAHDLDAFEAVGRTGHGFLWQDIMFALHGVVTNMRLFPSEVMKRVLAAHRVHFLHELRAFRRYPPKNLRRWGWGSKDYAWFMEKIGRNK